MVLLIHWATGPWFKVLQVHLSAGMPTHPSVNLKGESPHSLCHFTQACELPRHLSLLLTNTFELSHTECRQTMSTKPTAGRELEDWAVSFKTRAFLQKKKPPWSLDARGDEGGGGRGRRNGGLLCSSDSVKAPGGEIIYTTVGSGG